MVKTRIEVSEKQMAMYEYLMKVTNKQDYGAMMNRLKDKEMKSMVDEVNDK
jgi:ABC-type Na+ transport system ATPase subunit NatA